MEENYFLVSSGARCLQLLYDSSTWKRAWTERWKRKKVTIAVAITVVRVFCLSWRIYYPKPYLPLTLPLPLLNRKGLKWSCGNEHAYFARGVLRRSHYIQIMSSETSKRSTEVTVLEPAVELSPKRYVGGPCLSPFPSLPHSVPLSSLIVSFLFSHTQFPAHRQKQHQRPMVSPLLLFKASFPFPSPPFCPQLLPLQSVTFPQIPSFIFVKTRSLYCSCYYFWSLRHCHETILSYLKHCSMSTSSQVIARDNWNLKAGT